MINPIIYVTRSRDFRDELTVLKNSLLYETKELPSTIEDDDTQNDKNDNKNGGGDDNNEDVSQKASDGTSGYSSSSSSPTPSSSSSPSSSPPSPSCSTSCLPPNSGNDSNAPASDSGNVASSAKTGRWKKIKAAKAKSQSAANLSRTNHNNAKEGNVMGDGDGTVNLRSLKACQRWHKEQSQPDK